MEGIFEVFWSGQEDQHEDAKDELFVFGDSNNTDFRLSAHYI